MIKDLKFIGNGAAFNFDSGDNSIVISKPTVRFQVDCGSMNVNSTVKDIQSYIEEHPTGKLSFVITHLHADHVGGLPTVILFIYYALQKPVEVYVNYKIYKQLEYLLRTMDVPSNMYTLKTFNNELTTTVGGVEHGIQFYGLAALHPPMIASSLMISTPDANFYYSADNKVLPEEVITSLTNNELDYAFVDVCANESPVHLSEDELLELVPDELRHKVVVMHLSNRASGENLAEQGFINSTDYLI